jgi:hypothetical protein
VSNEEASIGLAASALAAGLFATRTAVAAEPRLLVFVHAAVKQRALEGELKQALPGVAVTAVGRIADFDRALAQGQDAVLALPVVLSARGLQPKLRGHRKGSASESYALVGADRIPDAASVKSVGALDLLGREGTNGFVHTLLGRSLKVERVTKVEDLLPLLQMGRVEAILLPSRLFGEIRTASRLNLLARDVARSVELCALSSTGPLAQPIISAVSRLPKALSATLGVDEWR